MVQSEQDSRKDESQLRPMEPPPLVTEGAQSLALPAKGSMYCLYAAAASEGLRLACSPRSGSLKEKR